MLRAFQVGCWHRALPRAQCSPKTSGRHENNAGVVIWYQPNQSTMKSWNKGNPSKLLPKLGVISGPLQYSQVENAAIDVAAISFSKISSIHNENQGKQKFPRSTNPCVNWSLGWQNNHSPPKVEDGLSYEGVCSTWGEGHTQQINRNPQLPTDL